MAAVVRQKEADGFEVVTTFFAGQMDSDYAFDLEGKPPPSAEGAAGALCTGAPAPAAPGSGTATDAPAQAPYVCKQPSSS